MPHWFLTCLIAVFLPGSPVAEAGKKPPNLIVFLTDQQRVDTLGAYGNTQIRTPHLDRLAQRSFVFDAFYVSNPVCTPSRASLLTGLYPNKHGSWMNSIPLDPKVPILVEMLRDPEYASAYYGKWHLGNEIFKQRGFTDFDSTEIYQKWWSEDQDHSQRSGYYHFLKEKGIEADTPYGHSRDLTNRLSKELSKPVYLAQRGIRFLEQHRDRPFALYLSFLEPHAFADHKQGPPFTNVYGDLYDPADMPIPDSFFEEMDPTVSFAKRLMRLALARGELPIAYPQTVQELREAMARYWGLVTLVDEMVGRVLERLRELGLEQNTIVVFTSEHGEMMGDHRLMSKMNSYEEAATVPFLLSVPGLWDRSRRIKKPVSQVDVTPTLLDLMGQPLPDHL
jgi:arylsulfatase A-like enzyme